MKIIIKKANPWDIIRDNFILELRLVPARFTSQCCSPKWYTETAINANKASDGII